jgi:serpin B
MRVTTTITIFSLAAATLVACGSASPSRSAVARRTDLPPVDPSQRAEYATAINALGLDVWRALGEDHRDRNLAISPASIATALAMTYGGARRETAAAMARTLHVDGDPDVAMRSAGELIRTWNDPDRTTYQLAVANRLFAQRELDLRAEYVTATGEHFGAEIARLDFAGAADPSRRAINEWVEAETHDRIRELLPPGAIDESTRLVLVDAVYFHGSWLRAFDPAATRDRGFHVRGGDPVPVPTMTARGGRYGEAEGVQVLELPYTGEELAMLFVLPIARDGLSAIEADLDADRVARWAASTSERGDLEIMLPRFRLETDSMALREPLVALGMGIAFTDAADFSGMSEPHEVPLKISDVYHRVFVELDEAGTEAAAATAVVMVEVASTAAPPPPPRFHADHPFLFFLRDLRSGAILFAGRIVDPRGR